jgi:hypothetical protein
MGDKLGAHLLGLHHRVGGTLSERRLRDKQTSQSRYEKHSFDDGCSQYLHTLVLAPYFGLFKATGACK